MKSINLNFIVKKEILTTFFLRSISLILSFWLIPLTLKYLGNEDYGIWVVLLTIMSWITLFDIGVGNGLRNKLAQALVVNDQDSCQNLISTAYCIISIISIFILFLLIIAIFLLRWDIIFNSNTLTLIEYRQLMLIFFSSVILSFLFGLIYSILSAFQRASYVNYGNIISSIIFITLLYFNSKNAYHNIIFITFLYGISLLLSTLIITFLFFRKQKNLIPKLKNFQFKLTREILTLGGSFFFIQIAVLLIFTVDSFMILQLLGPTHVTTYNIVYKLFSVFIAGFGIIMTPLWSAFTNAYHREDKIWVLKTIKNLNILLIPLIFALLIFNIYYQSIINIWMPKYSNIVPPRNLIFVFSFFVLISIWNNIYAYFLNGISETKVQTRTAIIGGILNIPLVFLFVKYLNFGLSGVVLSMCFSLLPFSIFGPKEAFRFINKMK